MPGIATRNSKYDQDNEAYDAQQEAQTMCGRVGDFLGGGVAGFWGPWA